MKSRGDRFNDLEELWTNLEQSGLAKRPGDVRRWELACCPNRAVSEKFKRILESRIQRHLAAQKVLQSRGQIGPFDPARESLLGYHVDSGQPVGSGVGAKNPHGLVSGISGAGKTCFGVSLIDQDYASGNEVIFSCHKGIEGARLSNRYEDLIVIRPDQITENLLEAPTFDSAEIFYTGWFNEFGRHFALLPITSSQLVSVMERIKRGLRPGDPWPSLKDLERLLHREGKADRKKFATAAYAMGALNAVLGRAARIRRGKKPPQRIKVYVWYGADPRYAQFLSSLVMLRTQAQAMAQGLSTGVKTRYVSDEGLMEFGKEFSQGAGSGYVGFAKRMITQTRSYNFMVVALVQELGNTAECLKSNAGFFAAFCSPNPREAREAVELLGQPPECVPKVQTLPIREALLRSEGCRGVVHIRTPYIDLGPYPSEAEVALRMAPKFAALEKDIVFAPEAESAPAIVYQEALGEEPTPGTPAPVPPPGPGMPSQGPAMPASQPSTTPPAPAGSFEKVEPTPASFALTPDLLALMRDLHCFPDSSVGERYARLQFGGSKGHRLQQQLLALNLIESVKLLQPNGAPRKLLRLTAVGQSVLCPA